jgi:16S rRNA (guanine(966)-N(2))-methyltransferase RsmD
MRIIAGTHRGRTLLGPEDEKTTRPITDRVKENLFNRLHSLGVLGYGRVADLFCGTGSMGLEALSRGAEHCTFVDQDRQAIARLRHNLDTLGVADDAARVIPGSAFLPGWTLGLPDGALTLALLDPPYAMTADLTPLLGLLEALRPKLEVGGVAMLRTPADVPAPPIPGYDGPAPTTYGGMTLHFYQSPLPEDDDPAA